MLSISFYSVDIVFIKLNIMLNSEINEKEAECLQSFFSIRSTLARELEMTELEVSNLVPFTKHDSEDIGTHELLVAEVTNYKPTNII
jgi:hypothetical protein